MTWLLHAYGCKAVTVRIRGGVNSIIDVLCIIQCFWLLQWICSSKHRWENKGKTIVTYKVHLFWEQEMIAYNHHLFFLSHILLLYGYCIFLKWISRIYIVYSSPEGSSFWKRKYTFCSSDLKKFYWKFKMFYKIHFHVQEDRDNDVFTRMFSSSWWSFLVQSR